MDRLTRREVLAGRVPVFVRASTQGQIESAVTWAARRDLDLVIVGGREAGQAAALLRAHAVPVIIGALILAPAPDFASLSVKAWIALLYTSAIAVAFGQWLWFRILHLLPASIASISTLAIPVVGVFSSSLLLGEVIGWREGAALILVLAALFLVLVGHNGLQAVKRALSRRPN